MVDLVQCHCGSMHDARTAECDTCSFQTWINTMERRYKTMIRRRRTHHRRRLRKTIRRHR